MNRHDVKLHTALKKRWKTMNPLDSVKELFRWVSKLSDNNLLRLLGLKYSKNKLCKTCSSSCKYCYYFVFECCCKVGVKKVKEKEKCKHYFPKCGKRCYRV